MSDILLSMLAVLSVITVVLVLVDHKRYIIKKTEEQDAAIRHYISNIKDVMIALSLMRQELGVHTAEIDYHLHGGVSDTICDEAREWQDGDISGAYMSRSRLAKTVNGGTSLSGIVCRYCHMRTAGGDLTCSHCGAQVVDVSATRIWSGK